MALVNYPYISELQSKSPTPYSWKMLPVPQPDQSSPLPPTRRCAMCTGTKYCSEMIKICIAATCPGVLCRSCYRHLPGYPMDHHCPRCRRECSLPVLDFSNNAAIR